MEKQSLTVSIMPTYRCNNACTYCYIGRTAKQFGPVMLANNYNSLLEERLTQISEKFRIERIELYGGDLDLIDVDFMKGMLNVTRRFCKEERITITNVEKAHEQWDFDIKDINISVNPERKDYLEALHTVADYPECGVLTVATNYVIDNGVENVLEPLRNAGHTGYLTIIPYSIGVGSHDPVVPNMIYSSFMIELMSYYFNNKDTYKFKLTNVILLSQCVRGDYSCLMRNNIFITPTANFACVAYSHNCTEYFREFTTLDNWVYATEEEEAERLCDSKCRTCMNFNNCMAEHYQPEWYREDLCGSHGLPDICNGYQPLVHWGREHPEWI